MEGAPVLESWTRGRRTRCRATRSLGRVRRLSVGKRLVTSLVGFVVLAGVVLLGSAFGGVDQVNGASRPTVSGNRAAAHAAATRIFAEVPVPVGAVEANSDPEVGSWLRGSVAGAPATRELVDMHGFWRLPGDPQSAIAWIKAHQPAGSTVSSAGWGGQYGTRLMWFVTFAFPAAPGRISQEGVGIAVTAATGGGTAMRADAFAIWLVPRPASEVIPKGTDAVEVFVDHSDHRAFPVGTVTARWKIRQLVAFIDSREIVQPGGATSCPALAADSPLLDLRFMSAAGGQPLARAVEDGCYGLSFWIRGRAQRRLSENRDLTEMLWRLAALPVCRVGQLSGSATTPTRVPAPPAITTQLIFRNVSASACALRGFARLRLLTASGRRLPSRVTNSSYPPHAVILTAHATAAVGLRWPIAKNSCKAPRVARLEVMLPGQTHTFTLPVGSPNNPFAPCHGIVRAGAIG